MPRPRRAPGAERLEPAPGGRLICLRANGLRLHRLCITGRRELGGRAPLRATLSPPTAIESGCTCTVLLTGPRPSGVPLEELAAVAVAVIAPFTEFHTCCWSFATIAPAALWLDLRASGRSLRCRAKLSELSTNVHVRNRIRKDPSGLHRRAQFCPSQCDRMKSLRAP